MIPKNQHWEAIDMKCKDCRGDSKDDSVCRDVAGHGECPILVYRRQKRRRGPDGKMLPIYSKKEVRRREKRFCVICMNGNPISHCRDYTCPLYYIVREHLKRGKDDAFSNRANEGRTKPLTDTQYVRKRPMAKGFLTYITGPPTKTEANIRAGGQR